MEVNEKDLREILTEQREEYQRYVGVLFGGLIAKLDKILEDQTLFLQELAI